MMLQLKNCTTLALITLIFTASTSAQSNNNTETQGCGTNITYTSQWFQIRWIQYCDTKITNDNTSTPIQRTSFADCSLACIQQGYGCAGFAFDRSSHYGVNNCYLDPPPIDTSTAGVAVTNAYFDSALVDPSSFPLTNPDCSTLSNDGVYNNMNLFCGQQILLNQSQIISTNFASSLRDCIDLCGNCTASSGCALPCKAVTWDPTLKHGYKNCYMMPQGYLAPIDNLAWDSATLVGTQGLPNTNSSSTNGSSTNSSEPTNTPTSGHNRSHGRLSTGAIAGVVVGSVVAALVVLGGALFLWLHSRRSRAAHAGREPAMRDVVGTKPELPANPAPTTGPQVVSNRVIPTVKPVSAADVKGKGRAISTESELSSAGPSGARGPTGNVINELGTNPLRQSSKHPLSREVTTAISPATLGPNERSARWA